MSQNTNTNTVTGFKLNPLNWESADSPLADKTNWVRANTPFGKVEVFKFDDGSYHALSRFPDFDSKFWPTIDEAKAAIEADISQRIEQMITTV